MEHRCGCRVTTDLDVQLFGYPASIGWGRLRNASLSGAFIETALRLPTLSVVRVTLPANAHYRNDAPFVDAMVVRDTPEGLGVEWLEAPSETVVSIVRNDFVEDARRPRRRAGAQAEGYGFPLAGG